MVTITVVHADRSCEASSSVHGKGKTGVRVGANDGTTEGTGVLPFCEGLKVGVCVGVDEGKRVGCLVLVRGACVVTQVATNR